MAKNSVSPPQLAILSAVVAIALTKDLNAKQANILGNFLTAVASIILAMAPIMPTGNPNETVQYNTTDNKN